MGEFTYKLYKAMSKPKYILKHKEVK